MSQHRKVYGLGAEFNSAADLMHAAEKIRDAGFAKWDVHTPFPVHGMDKAMGLGKSWLSAAVFCGGFTGALTGISLTTIPSFFLYPMIVDGKPYSCADAGFNYCASCWFKHNSFGPFKYYSNFTTG